MEAWETRKHSESGAKCLIAMVFILLVYYSAVLVYAFVIITGRRSNKPSSLLKVQSYLDQLELAEHEWRLM